MRGNQGLSMIEVILAMGILASVGGMTFMIVAARQTAPQAQNIRHFADFVDRFIKLANDLSITDPNFNPASLATTYPLTEGSTVSAIVEFKGCAVPSEQLGHNTLSSQQIADLNDSIKLQTPATAISFGVGQTGGIILNEKFDRAVSARATLFVYEVTGPLGTRPMSVQVIGSNNQCP